MNYLGIIIIAFMAVKEYRCCGPAGTPKSMCEKWNEVLASAGLARRLTTDPADKRSHEKLFQCFDIFNKKDIINTKYYVTFGVDMMQLHAYEVIKNELSEEPLSRYLFYLFAEASVRVSKYFYRMHNHEKGITFIHDAIYKIENLPNDPVEPYKTFMWMAYLRESQFKLVQEIDKYKSSAEYVEKMRKDSYDLALSSYEELLSPESRVDPDMTFLIGKEKLRFLNAHLPLGDKSLNVTINSDQESTVEAGIDYLEKYDKMSKAGDLVESRFILGNAYMVIGDLDNALNCYAKALLTPVKNAEDRAFNYEVQQTLGRFYDKLTVALHSPSTTLDSPSTSTNSVISKREILKIFDNIDVVISRKCKNFWNELMQEAAFGSNIIYNFINNALIYNVKTSIESENYEPNRDILVEAKSALKKLEHQISVHDFSKWMAVISGAETNLITKHKDFLYLRIHLDYGLKNKDSNNDDHLTYLHGKYLCKTALNPQRYDSFNNVVGWSIPTSDIDKNKNMELCLNIMKNENITSKFMNDIDRNILLATAYWHKKKFNEATEVLVNTIFTKPVLNAEDRWNNFLAQELLGLYQAENIKYRKDKVPFYPDRTYCHQ